MWVLFLLSIHFRPNNTLLLGLEITAEQEFCLYELEATDSTSIGLVLRCHSLFTHFIILQINSRAIYDTGDVHKFSRALEKRITHYDKNILRVCTYHYQGFLDSIKQLSNLKEKCNEIKVNFMVIA